MRFQSSAPITVLVDELEEGLSSSLRENFMIIRSGLKRYKLVHSNPKKIFAVVNEVCQALQNSRKKSLFERDVNP